MEQQEVMLEEYLKPSISNKWCEEEFENIDFGDSRIKDRFIRTASKLSDSPLSPINKACETWKDTKAAYRLFDNPKVTADKIYQSHYNRTLERIKKYNVVFAIQDTFYLTYGHHPKTEGLGRIAASGEKNTTSRGFIMHSTLCISTDGLPLGLIDQKIWARTTKVAGRGNSLKYKLPISEKESFKWCESIQKTIERISCGTRVISICDR